MPLRKPVHGIFFDLGWTLLYPVSGNWMFSNFARAYFRQEILDSLPQERVTAAMKQAMDHLDQNHQLDTIDQEYQQFLTYYTMVAEALPELGLSQAQLRKVAEDHVYNLENVRLYPASLPTLQALAGRYRLGIISDTWPSILSQLEHLGLSSFFQCATYSYTLGTYKPDPRMYQDALEKMGLPPEETIFVDDSTGNLQGAAALGIQPVLIQAKPSPSKPDPGMTALSDLGELPELLG